MKNRFYYYQLLDEREEQQLHKAGAESFHISTGLLFLAYFISVLAPSLFNPSMLLAIIIIGNFYFINRARSLGVTYYSRFHFTILGCLLLTLVITATLMLKTTSSISKFISTILYILNTFMLGYLPISFIFLGSLLET